MTDWAIYSFTKQPLQQRILVSSLCSVPLDTVVFQHLAGYLSPAAFTLEVLSKAVGVAVVWYLLRMRVGNAEMAAV
jgi:queuosine precursor transporter